LAKVRSIAIKPRRPIDRMRQASVLLVLAGLALQSALPGFELSMRARVPWTILGLVCHAKDPGQPASDSEGSPSDGCCVVCQALELAKGALPSAAFIIPAPPPLPLPTAAAATAAVDGHPSLFKQARAPPP
jgi:hypothetical protein